MALIHFPGRLGEVREKLALASICPSNWTAFLLALERLFPGASATLDRISAKEADATRYPCAIAERAGWAQTGERGAGSDLVDLPVGTLFRLADMPEISPPTGLHAANARRCGAGILLHRRGPHLWALSVRVPAGLGNRYDPVISTLLRRLGPDLRQSFLISHGLGTAEQPDRATIESRWDTLPIGVALLSASLKPLAANTMAEEFVSTRRFFAPLGRRGSLRAAVNNDNDRMQDAACRIVFGESEVETVALEGMRCVAPLSVTFRAVGRKGESDRRGTRIAASADSLVAIFGLWETSSHGFGSRRSVESR